MPIKNIEKFVSRLAQSLQDETFVKMTLGNYRGNDPLLQKILVRLIKTKKGIRLFFLYRYETRDTAKNFDFDQGLKLVEELLGSDFFAGHLFTTTRDFQLDIGKKGKSRLNSAKPTFITKPKLDHDKKKHYLVDPSSFYLKALGITTDTGEIRSRQHNKWKQINKFVETLSALAEKTSLKEKPEITIVDMGSGKGYLTFAAYDFFQNKLEIETQITGVEAKRQLVDLCNGLAKTVEFRGLNFVHDDIENFPVVDADILIALHACNTATDDAIYRGINAGAELIVVAPCCHQELRPQIKAPDMFRNVLKHGIILEREAESLTDGLRSLLLERSGYSTKVFEFIATEHTPKNNMIVGIKNKNIGNSDEISNEIESIKGFFKIDSIRLERLLEPKKTV
ncbi:MAG: SAM-dependent methyltransferase [Pyrinomonadaceae bacterium]|nr:SAM-dependent methyltransferase [Pyrinomonadaceae bacterium]